MDADNPSIYGYDTEYIKVTMENGKYAVSRSPRKPEDIPTALQMEFRYSHDERIEALEGRVK